MEKALLTNLLILISFSNLYSQQVVSVSGNSYEGLNLSINWTIGEVIDETLSNDTSSITQGMQQPDFNINVVVESSEVDLAILAFPNPATENIKLLVNTSKYSNARFLLFDINGKTIMEDRILTTETLINLELLVPSTYFLKVISNNKEVKTFKIIKAKKER